jgi:tetratricopeptide (TPR) repeat protein
VEADEQEAALQAYRTVLEFDPEDVECRLLLESLERLAGASESASQSDESDEEDDEEIIEDLEIIEEFDEEFYEEYSETAPLAPETRYDPLATVTLAELYVTQGYVVKALEIYRAILVDSPSDRTITERILELEALHAGILTSGVTDDDYSEEETDDVTVVTATTGELFPITSPIPAVPLQGTSDSVLATLDGWLENIRRIKSCRSEIH